MAGEPARFDRALPTRLCWPSEYTSVAAEPETVRIDPVLVTTDGLTQCAACPSVATNAWADIGAESSMAAERAAAILMLSEFFMTFSLQLVSIAIIGECFECRKSWMTSCFLLTISFSETVSLHRSRRCDLSVRHAGQTGEHFDARRCNEDADPHAEQKNAPAR